jgi:PAS domain S-box-containing protein
MDSAINAFFSSGSLGLRLFQHSAIPCAVLDDDCNHVVVNELFCRWIKCPDTYCNQNNLKGCDDHCRLWFKDNVLESVAHFKVENPEICLTDLSGNKIWAEVFVTVFPSESQKKKCRFVQFFDVSTRKQKEIAGKEVDVKLRLLFESMNEAFALHEIITNEFSEPIDYLYIDVNPAFERMVGFKRDEIVGHRVLEVMPQTEEFWIKEFGKIALEGGTTELVNYARELDKYYEVKVYSPAPRHFAVVFSDISPRIHAEKALKESEERYRLLAENTGDFVALYDYEGIFLYASPSVKNLLGYTPEELIGSTPQNMICPDDFSKVHDRLQLLYEKGETPIFDFRIKHKDGHLVWLEASLKLVNNDKEHPRILASNRDITRRKEDEQKILASEAHHRFLIENILDVIWVYDVVSDRFAYVSASVEKLRGYTPEEVMAQTLFETFPPESLEKVKVALPLEIEKFIMNGHSDIFKDEFEQYCKDGSRVWIEVVAYLRLNESNGHIEIIGTSRNISDRHRAEIARQEIEQRYRILTEVTNEGIIIHQNGIIVDVNPSLLRMLKMSDDREQIVGKSLHAILPQNEAEEVRSKIQSAYSGVFQVQLFRRDNSSFPAEVVMRMIDFNGIRYRVASVNDITLRVEAEKQLIESEGRFRSIFDNAIAGIAFAEIDGKLLMFNRAFGKIVGHDYRKLKGISFYDITYPDDVIKEKKLIDEACHSGKDSITFEKRYIGDNQQVTWGDVSVSIIRNQQGVPTSLVAVVNDITLKKQNEQELLRALEYNKTINQTSPVGILTTNEKGEIIFANNMILSIMGVSQDDLIGKTYNSSLWKISTLEGEELHPSEFPYEQVKAQLKPVYNERYTVQLPDSECVFLSFNSSPLFNSSGEFEGIISTIEDISDKLEVEKQLQQTNEQLYELNRQKDRFFSIIAHDLRGSLGNITNLSELLYLGYKTQELPMDETIVRTIYDSSLKTLNLLENLLAWANSQRHSVTVNHEKVNLSTILKDSVAVSEAIASEKNISLVFNLDNAIIIHTDRAMLSTIVRNLVSNAIKYSFENSEIVISSHLQKDGQHVEICVADSGVGMDEETLTDLFEIDRNISVHGTAGEEGTGLGLVLCREFVNKLRGTIRVESKLGKGSCFCVLLPLA